MTIAVVMAARSSLYRVEFILRVFRKSENLISLPRICSVSNWDVVLFHAQMVGEAEPNNTHHRHAEKSAELQGGPHPLPQMAISVLH